MKKYTITAIIASICILCIYSCGKYEEGPKISLKSKAARVAASWKIDAMLINGEDFDISKTVYPYYTYVYEKDGTGKQINEEYTTQIGNVSDQVIPAATFPLEWKFDASKEKIKFFVDDGTNTQWTEYRTILKLKEKEMWLLVDDTIEYHFVKTTEE